MIDDLIDLTTMQPSKVLRTRFTPTDLMWIVVVGGVPYLAREAFRHLFPGRPTVVDQLKVLAELIAAAGEEKATSLKVRISTAAKTRWEMPESIQEANVLGENDDTRHGPWRDGLSVAGSVLPEVFEARRRHLGVAHRVLDVFVPEIGLQGAGVDALVGQLIPASVPQHVRVHWEFELCGDAQPHDHFAEACRGERRSPLRGEDDGRNGLLLALELAQGSQLTAGNGMDSRRTILGSIDVQSTVTEVDRIPTQGHKLAYPQAMPIGDQDHGGVAVAMAVAAGGDD